MHFRFRGKELLTEGYQKASAHYLRSSKGRQRVGVPAAQFHNSVFKVALLDQWLVVVTRSLLEEYRKRADDELSFIEGVENVRTQLITWLPLLPVHLFQSDLPPLPVIWAYVVAVSWGSSYDVCVVVWAHVL